MSPHPSPGRLSLVDDLPPEERDAIRAHVGQCGACRAIWAGADPTRLFALLADRALPEDLVDAVSAGVAAGIDGGATSVPWTRRAVVAVAASVLLALGAVFFGSPGPGPGEAAPVAEPVAELREITPGAQLVLLESPGDPRVMDLTMGDMQVVMIFDEEFDL